MTHTETAETASACAHAEAVEALSSDQAERELPPVLVFVALDECLKVRGDFPHLHVGAPAVSVTASSETSRAQRSATLKPTTRTGLVYIGRRANR